LGRGGIVDFQTVGGSEGTSPPEGKMLRLKKSSLIYVYDKVRRRHTRASPPYTSVRREILRSKRIFWNSLLVESEVSFFFEGAKAAFFPIITCDYKGQVRKQVREYD
jgi:hypothetical protein